jgi:hypothetical protein
MVTIVSGAEQFESAKVVFIYDRATGRVVHTHQHFVVKGERHPDAKTLEAEALQEIAQRIPDLSHLAVLQVDPTTLDTEAFYKVDTHQKLLVKQPLPNRKQLA